MAKMKDSGYQTETTEVRCRRPDIYRAPRTTVKMPHLPDPINELKDAAQELARWFTYLHEGEQRQLRNRIKEALQRQVLVDLQNLNFTESWYICESNDPILANNMGWLQGFRNGTNLPEEFLLSQTDMSGVIDPRYINNPRKEKVYWQLMHQTFRTWLGDRHTSTLLLTQRQDADTYKTSSTVTNVLMVELINKLQMYPVLTYYSSHRKWPWQYNDEQYDPAGVMFHCLNYQLMYYICNRRLKVAFGTLLENLGGIVSKDNVDQQADLFYKLLKLLRDAKVRTVFVIVDLNNLMTVGDEFFNYDRSNLHRGIRRILAKAGDANNMRIRILVTRPYLDRTPVENPNFELQAPDDLTF